jgi:hypothetical protein
MPSASHPFPVQNFWRLLYKQVFASFMSKLFYKKMIKISSDELCTSAWQDGSGYG